MEVVLLTLEQMLEQVLELELALGSNLELEIHSTGPRRAPIQPQRVALDQELEQVLGQFLVVEVDLVLVQAQVPELELDLVLVHHPVVGSLSPTNRPLLGRALARSLGCSTSFEYRSSEDGS